MKCHERGLGGGKISRNKQDLKQIYGVTGVVEDVSRALSSMPVIVDVTSSKK